MLRLFKRRLPVYRAETVQVGNRLIILDGHNPIRYIDLSTNKVKMYKPNAKYGYKYKVKHNA